MIEKKTIKNISRKLEQSDSSLRNRNNLKFFVERSSETVERTLSIVEKLQHEIIQLKDGITKAENELHNFRRFSYLDKKKNPDKN